MCVWGGCYLPYVCFGRRIVAYNRRLPPAARPSHRCYAWRSLDWIGLDWIHQARGKGDMIQNFQKFIALFFFVWWTLGAGKRIHPSITLHTNQRFPLLRRGFRFAKKQAQQQSQSKAFGREGGGGGEGRRELAGDGIVSA